MLGARTELGSRTVLTVLARRGAWAQVSTAVLGGRRAWLRIDGHVARRRTRWELRADVRQVRAGDAAGLAEAIGRARCVVADANADADLEASSARWPIRRACCGSGRLASCGRSPPSIRARA